MSEPTWNQAASVTWVIFWRTALGAALLNTGCIFILKLAVFGSPEMRIALYAISGVILFLWGVVVVRQALRKKYEDFRIALLPKDADIEYEGILAIAESFARQFRDWLPPGAKDPQALEQSRQALAEDLSRQMLSDARFWDLVVAKSSLRAPGLASKLSAIFKKPAKR